MCVYLSCTSDTISSMVCGVGILYVARRDIIGDDILHDILWTSPGCTRDHEEVASTVAVTFYRGTDPSTITPLQLPAGGPVQV